VVAIQPAYLIHCTLTPLLVIPLLFTTPSSSPSIYPFKKKQKNHHLIITDALLLPKAGAMDAWEATKVVFDRVRALDPDNASKIMDLLPTWILDTWLVYLQIQMCSSAPDIVTLGLLFPLEMDRSGGLQLEIGL